MKILKLYLFLLSILLPCFSTAQNIIPANIIEGKITDKSDNKPLSFASVYNRSTRKGTITNTEGYFRLSLNNFSDTIVITLIGYKKETLQLKHQVQFYNIGLEENAHLLGQVVVKPKDNTYLYELLAECKKKKGRNNVTSKAYYELKTQFDDTQVELVECFYNGRINGYDIEGLDIKTGRIAIRPHNDRIFLSMESSRIITLQKLFEYGYFPESPLELPLRKMKNNFYLDISTKYRDDNNDSVYVIEFTPKNSTGKRFKGQVWVKPASKNIIKINLKINGAKKHPFLPLFSTDSIKNLDLDITKTFEELNSKMFFKQVNFTYQITYKSRKTEPYIVKTSAVLHMYDYNSSFQLPKFEFTAAAGRNDYRKINGIPYNDYFWQNTSELKMTQKDNQNEQFFNSEDVITNKQLFEAEGYYDYTLMQIRYVIWNGNRVRFREFTSDTSSSANAADGVLAERYKLSVKLFLDVNTIDDSLQIVTATIFDPYESFYKFPITNTALCFINTYFDLVEIERRNLEKAILQSDKKPETINKIYDASQLKVAQISNKYFTEVMRGNNEKQMEKWSRYTSEKLNINNLEIFRPYAKKANGDEQK